MDGNLPSVRIFFGKFRATMDHIQNTHSNAQNELAVVIAVVIHFARMEITLKTVRVCGMNFSVYGPRIRHIRTQTEPNVIK